MEREEAPSTHQLLLLGDQSAPHRSTYSADIRIAQLIRLGCFQLHLVHWLIFDVSTEAYSASIIQALNYRRVFVMEIGWDETRYLVQFNQHLEVDTGLGQLECFGVAITETLGLAYVVLGR